MGAHRRCSECPNSLAGKSIRAKTCSDACRLKRSRRMRRANQEVEQFSQDHNVGAQEVAAIVARESTDVITKVMHRELGPVVREALTEDVLRAVEQMLGLTPRAVQLLKEDLESEDSTVRQRAYTLVTKYTIGHPALLQPKDGAGTGQLVVQFNLPRPDDAPTELDPDEAVELKVCDMCNAEKPDTEFVSGSDRCRDCFAAWREKVLTQFT